MAVVNNDLQQVVTYNKGFLAYLLNQNCFYETANFHFDGFENKVPMNLGSSVAYSLQYRVTAGNSLTPVLQGIEQRKRTLTVDFPLSAGFNYSDTEFIFNKGKDVLPDVGKAAVYEIGALFESRVAQLAETNTFRFYGNALTPIETSFQLAKMLAFFRNFGAARMNTRCYLSDMVIPNIIQSNLGQYAVGRNEKNASSWDLGEMDQCKFYKSNLLPTHVSGTEGAASKLLTVSGVTTDPNSGAVTAIEFSGTVAANDTNSVKAYDKFQFSDGVSGFNDLRFLTFIGHKVSQCPVNFAAAADATSTGSNKVTVTLTYPLQATSGGNQNINQQIVVGMQGRFIPSHRCGLVTSGDPLFCAMPMLNDKSPYTTAREMDSETGVSLRTYHGAQLLEPTQAWITDGLLGCDLDPEMAMMVVLPV